MDVRGFTPGPLLCPVRKGGEVQLRHMHPDAVLKILRRRAKEAGVKSFSPHDFRRTFCSDLLDAGVDIVIAYTCTLLFGRKIKNIGLQKYISRLTELGRVQRRHSSLANFYNNLLFVIPLKGDTESR